MKISFIGYGNIAKALAEGLRHDHTNELRAAAPSLLTGISDNGVRTYADNLAVISDADMIILAVKPALISTVLAQISAHRIPKDCLIISIASGISLSSIAKQLPNVAVVRAMPNIASALSKGATPMIANDVVTNEQKQRAEQLFINLGLVTWVRNESDINAFTAVSGSGPAYIFMFMEAMIKSAINLGIAEDVATEFVKQTFNGAIALATSSALKIPDLRKTVTAPAGTTAAAISVLCEHHFDSIIDEAMKAACERAQQLGTVKN